MVLGLTKHNSDFAVMLWDSRFIQGLSDLIPETVETVEDEVRVHSGQQYRNVSYLELKRFLFDIYANEVFKVQGHSDLDLSSFNPDFKKLIVWYGC